jgi:hypothetical protein
VCVYMCVKRVLCLCAYLCVKRVDLIVDLVVVEGEGETAAGCWHHVVHDASRVLIQVVDARL